MNSELMEKLESLLNKFQERALSLREEYASITSIDNDLTKEDISSIVILMCKELKNRLKDLDINLEMKQDAIDLIAKDGINLEYGARPLKRSIQNNLENELSELILQQVIKAGDDVVADVKDDKMILTVQ